MSSASREGTILEQWFKLFRSQCDRLGILVVGVTGAGKSTLINNLLAKTVAKEGDTVHSETSSVQSYDGVIQNVKVRIYDTPGLGDSREDHDDDAYLSKIKSVLKKGEIHVVVYCFKMDDTRIRRGIIRTFKQYHELGISWEKTLIALTFADALSVPSKKRKEPGFTMSKFFCNKLAEWQKVIPEVIARELEIDPHSLSQIKITPTVDDRETQLPNGGNWFNSLFLQMLELLPPYAMVKFLDIHQRNIVLDGDGVSPQPPASLGLPAPQADDSRSVAGKDYAPPSVSDSEGPKIVLSGNEREKFQETIGKKVSEGISIWSVVEKVGLVAAGATAVAAGATAVAASATALAAGVTALAVTAPVIAVGAVLAAPFVAVGAAVASVFGWLKDDS